ncbi:MAG: tRNA (adenosine(37)-N6)-threonylcarbamoyltransferase complex transferase subunit TsaD [Nitrospirales bacterium]|nr:tRNA (adenosine(37)-N6)-threonylcarbamoyltransferase complex transferase subunit TsaD [Nitrospirales bacterium]
MALLAIESSCDETAAAVINLDGHIASNVISSQHEVHRQYGGVVPELASRSHIEKIESVVREAMSQAQVDWPAIQAIAVTRGPGLAGALVVGVSFGKALAFALGVPWIAVNHLEGHVASAWLDKQVCLTPCVIFIVSGGHTHLYLVPEWGSYELVGRTLDDAAGEAFDKGANMLGLGHPGGPALDRLARTGNPDIVRFPRPYHHKGGLNFSFSGIKTSLLYYLRDRQQEKADVRLEDIAAGYQEAIVEVLIDKAFRAVDHYHVSQLAVVGGVSANSRLRALLSARASANGVQLALPKLEYCTDNAAMIAAAGLQAYHAGRFAAWDLDAVAAG